MLTKFDDYDVELRKLVPMICEAVISSAHKLIIQKANVDLVFIAFEDRAKDVHVMNLSFGYKLLFIYFFIKLCVAVNEDICDIEFIEG